MAGTKKIFVLDYNIIRDYGDAIFTFDEHTVVIPMAILEIIDKVGSSKDGLPSGAAAFIRNLDSLREKGNLMSEGAPTAGGGKIRISKDYNLTRLPAGLDDTQENRILKACLAEQNRNQDAEVILVTNSSSMRLKADLAQVQVQPYKNRQVSDIADQYTGRGELTVPSEMIDDVYINGATSIKKLLFHYQPGDLVENQYYILRDVKDGKHSALTVYQDGEFKKLLWDDMCRPYGIVPKNVGQKFAIDALIRSIEEAPLCILKGPAGTAKTFLALAVGLQKVINEHEFRQILVARPNVKFDDDIGFLKGSEQAKIDPLIRPIHDNLMQLTQISGSKKKDGIDLPNNYASQLFENGTIVAQALAYMRGRSIANSWIIIDEAQNATPEQMFGIISRVGLGSKLILCGDPEQIDNQFLDTRTNGITFASERMKGSPLCWQVAFGTDECVRSELAQEAIEHMGSGKKK